MTYDTITAPAPAPAPARARWRWVAACAGLLAIAVLAVVLVSQYVLEPSAENVEGFAVPAGQTTPVSLRSTGGELMAGSVLQVVAHTDHAEQARLVLRNGSDGSSLGTVDGVTVPEDGSLAVDVDQVADLAPGEYRVQLYLDGSDTAAGAVGFTVAAP